MTATLPVLTFRAAEPEDADGIARLHAESWRTHYRGSLSDAYIDGPMEDERRTLWRHRLAVPPPGQIVLLAQGGSALVGFVCAFTDQDPAWGTLIDNLHVAPAHKRGGIGRRLMRQVADLIAAHAPLTCVHLYVLDANRAARAFYERIGGEPAGREVHALPGGTEAPVWRMVWPSASALARAADPDVSPSR